LSAELAEVKQSKRTWKMIVLEKRRPPLKIPFPQDRSHHSIRLNHLRILKGEVRDDWMSFPSDNAENSIPVEVVGTDYSVAS